MWTPLKILHFEGVAFLYGLAAVVVYQALTRRINLMGLLQRKDLTGKTSPERIQLLMATLAAASRFLTEVAKAPPGVMPDIDPSWLYLMGGSSGIYVLHKAWSTYQAAQKLGDKS